MILLFININKLSIIVFKFVISIIMNIIAFKSYDIKNNLILFYVINIILGGFIYIIKDNFNINLIFIYFFIPIILYKIIKFISKNNNKNSLKHSLELVIGKTKYITDSFIDTGNVIKDPYFNRNIIIVSKSLIKCDKEILVPCKTINGESIIRCIKPDKVYIDGKLFNNLLVGESTNKLFYALLPGNIEIGG